MAGLRQERSGSLHSTSSIALYHTMLDQTRRSGPRQGEHQSRKRTYAATYCGVGHISDHSRGRRDMPLALSVWWCGPTGLAARAEHGNRWHRYISLQVVKVLRVCARVFARARFHGRVSRRSASNSTHNASPRPALPPRGLAWLPSCSLTCVHMLMAGLRNKSQESDH